MDIIDRRPGGGGASAQNVKYKDEGDGSHSESIAANLQAWNETDGDYNRLVVNDSGELVVTTAGGPGGSGTEYTEGDTDASITGSAVMWEDTSDTLRAVSAAKPFPVNVVAGGAGDGAIQDGANSAIEASVLDYTNSNPLAVRLTDTNGDYIAAGAGTQYTEDDASAANPIGNAVIARRRDSLAAETTTDGDNVAANATNKGELYVKHVDAIPVTDNSGSLTVDNAALSVVGSGTEATAQRVTIATDSTGVLSVDDNGGSLTVDDGAGSLTVDNATISVVGSGTEATAQRVTIATDSTGVLSVDDNGSSLTVDNGGTFAVQDSEKVADNAGFTDGTTKVQPAGFIFDESAGTALTENDAAAARVDSKRAQVLVIEDETTRGRRATVTAANAIKVDNSGVTQPVSNAGTFVVQENGAALTALQLIDDTIVADDALFTVATTKVSVAGYFADEDSTDSVNEGDAGAARMTLDRKQIVTVQGNDKGGLSTFRSLDLDETEEDVKTSPGTVYGMWVTNSATSTRWLKFYNATSANVTVGSTTPMITYGIPGNTSDDIAANVMGAAGIKFDTAISVACTTAAADADTGAPSTGDVVINVFYH